MGNLNALMYLFPDLLINFVAEGGNCLL